MELIKCISLTWDIFIKVFPFILENNLFHSNFLIMPSKKCLEFLYENLTLEKIHFLTFYNIWGWLGIKKMGKRNTIEFFYAQLLSYWRILLNYLIHSSSFSIPCLGFVKIIISFASGQIGLFLSEVHRVVNVLNLQTTADWVMCSPSDTFSNSYTAYFFSYSIE